jgi:hypothetical protein
VITLQRNTRVVLLVLKPLCFQVQLKSAGHVPAYRRQCGPELPYARRVKNVLYCKVIGCCYVSNKLWRFYTHSDILLTGSLLYILSDLFTSKFSPTSTLYGVLLLSILRNDNQTGNVHINVTLRRVYVTIIAVEKQ